MSRAVSTLPVLCLALVSCAVEEYALLLEVDVAADVQDLEVEVRSLDADGSSEVEVKRIGREASAIAEMPLRVAVSLPSPQPVAVRIVSRAVGGAVTHGAFRCYEVDGVVRERFSLVDSALVDGDGDGWPSDLSSGCGEPCGAFACPTFLSDCDDARSSINPGAIEVCGADLDCDGEVLACQDEDGDGHQACPPGTRGGDCDCNDLSDEIYPGADEACPSSIDYNCDGRAGNFCDRDGDGSPSDLDRGGVPDCDDTNPSVFPDADELCTMAGGTPVDENCNGAFDEGCEPDDLDGDGVLPEAGDCDDCDPASAPGAVEICGDDVDQDCDMIAPMCGADDVDGDGVRSVAMGGRDCDDTRADIYPEAAEQCAAGRDDEDCDGAIDEGCPAADLDGDQYVELGALSPCEGDATRHPGRAEECDGIDQDCDGIVDEGAGGADGACIRDLDGMAFVVDYSDSMQHCGGCRLSCSRRRSDGCVDGACQCSSNGRDAEPCAAGEFCCDGSGSAGGCRVLDEEFESCGACGNACDEVTADACVGGVCVCGSGLPCGPGLTCCDGECVDLDVDPNNCSACGARCGRHETCETGLCTCFDEQADDPGDDACTGSEECCRVEEKCEKPDKCG